LFVYLDKGLLEFVGPTGLNKLTSFISQRFAMAQTGFVYDYAFILICGVCITFILDFLI
jgi:hypothetical protein